MQRYFLEMAYDGTNFHGWQVQPNAITVQELMNDALWKIFRQPKETTYIVGAGRTDTGVHSDYFVAHFDLPEAVDASEIEHILFKFNAILPPDVSVFSMQAVDEKMHARFSAQSRTYHYRLSLNKVPSRRLTHFTPFFLPDFDKMNEAATLLLNYTDFTSFARLHADTKTNDCFLSHAFWREVSVNEWFFEIKANRFLRNMVRAIVGTLLEVGRGKLSIERFREIIEAKNRCLAGSSAEARGLSLVDIQYPEGKGFIRTLPTVSLV